MQENSTTHLEHATDLIPFNYKGYPVRICREPEGGPWYIAQDVCAILELQDVSRALIELDRDEKTDIPGNRVGCNISKLRAVNEFGVYHLIFKSRKPEAKQFKRWLTHEVIPAIRRTGRYTPDGTSPDAQQQISMLEAVHNRGVMWGRKQVCLLVEHKMDWDDLANIRAWRKAGLSYSQIGMLKGCGGDKIMQIERDFESVGLAPVKPDSHQIRQELARQLDADFGFKGYSDTGMVLPAPAKPKRKRGLSHNKRAQVVEMLNAGRSHIEISKAIPCDRRTVDRIFNQEVAK